MEPCLFLDPVIFFVNMNHIQYDYDGETRTPYCSDEPRQPLLPRSQVWFLTDEQWQDMNGCRKCMAEFRESEGCFISSHGYQVIWSRHLILLFEAFRDGHKRVEHRMHVDDFFEWAQHSQKIEHELKNNKKYKAAEEKGQIIHSDCQSIIWSLREKLH
jgi:hypothetical protein